MIASHIRQFDGSDLKSHGIIQLLLSAILSRGIPVIKGDMDTSESTLIGKHAYCTQEMVNLALMGKATSNTHDGDIEFAGSTLKGIHSKCEIGQLSLFEHYKHITIGSNLKSPQLPIWVVCSESHYTVLFSLPSFLENIFYYDGLGGQTEEIKLTLINTNTPEESDSPLDHCIRTKWALVNIDWNGTEKLL